MFSRFLNSPFRSCTPFIIQVVFATSVFAHAPASLQLTASEVEESTEVLDQKIKSAVYELSGIPFNQRTFENTFQPWNRLGKQLYASISRLALQSQIDRSSREKISQKLQEIQNYLFQNEELYEALLSYANNALSNKQSLTPYQQYVVQTFLEHCERTKTLGSDEESSKMLHKVSAHPAQFGMELPSKSGTSPFAAQRAEPFIHLRGAVREKLGDGQFSVLSLALGASSDRFSTFDETVLWNDRIPYMMERVQAMEPDILCLEEVFNEDAAYIAYSLLKNDYAHFYIDIGTKVLGFSSETLGLPSGLLIASKYPIQQAHFTPFAQGKSKVNYGFFDFIVGSAEHPLAHVYATQLQRDGLTQYEQGCAKQITQIVNKMQKDLRSVSDRHVPFFICGDSSNRSKPVERNEQLIHCQYDTEASRSR